MDVNKVGYIAPKYADRCLNCNKKNDGYLGCDVPTSGSLSICFQCNHVTQFGADLKFAELKIEEIPDIKKSLLETLKNRRHFKKLTLMIEGGLTEELVIIHSPNEEN